MQTDLRSRWRAWQSEATLLSLRILGKVWPAAAGARALDIFLTPRRSPTPPAPPRQAQAKRITATHGSLTLVGYEWGSGPTIVLAHGWEGHARHFEALIKVLVEQGFRVLVFDGPAHGASPGQQTNLIDYGTALGAIIEQHGPALAIIAHSFGAAASMLLLGRAPHLPVKHAILIGSPSELSLVLDSFARSLKLDSGVRRAMDHALFKRFGVAVEGFGVRSIADQVGQSGLVIHDHDDPVIPWSEGASIAAAWPRGRLIATKGLGHRGPLRNPAVIKEILAFLRNGDQPPAPAASTESQPTAQAKLPADRS